MPMANRLISSLRIAMLSALILTFCGLCLYPFVMWSAHPSLYHDDFLRVGTARRNSLAEAMFQPFNEHLAPLFVLVTWLAWQATAQQVVWMPLATMVASDMAFAVSAGLLTILIRREARSTTAALGGLAIFCLSSVSAETVLWFSASSFQWSLAATLGAWLAATSVERATTLRLRTVWLGLTMLATMAAPAFSAIGFLTAPVACLRLVLAEDRPFPRIQRLATAMVPMIGLGLFLGVGSLFRYQDVVGQSLHRSFDPGAVVWGSLLAPVVVLIPYLLGQADLVFETPPWLAASLSGGLLIACLVWTRMRWKSSERALVLGGLVLMAGGYLLVHASKAHADGLWVLKVPRYHLFPQAGLICVLAGVFAPVSRMLDQSPIRRWLALTMLAASLAPGQYPKMRRAAEGSYQFPDQAHLLVAEQKLEAIVLREGITLGQAMAALDPIEPEWSPASTPFHPILYLFPKCSETPRIADADVRARLISGLDPVERGLIFAGMDGTRYRFAEAGQPRVETQLVNVHQFQNLGNGRYHTVGPGHLEFQVPEPLGNVRALVLPGLRTRCRKPLEVWWTDESGDWSTCRSIRWMDDPAHPATDWAVPLDQLPHWKPGSVRRLRLVLRDSGELTVGNPRFLR